MGVSKMSYDEQIRKEEKDLENVSCIAAGMFNGLFSNSDLMEKTKSHTEAVANDAVITYNKIKKDLGYQLLVSFHVMLKV